MKKILTMTLIVQLCTMANALMRVGICARKYPWRYVSLAFPDG